jgi:hypothetical protein
MGRSGISSRYSSRSSSPIHRRRGPRVTLANLPPDLLSPEAATTVLDQTDRQQHKQRETSLRRDAVPVAPTGSSIVAILSRLLSARGKEKLLRLLMTKVL